MNFNINSGLRYYIKPRHFTKNVSRNCTYVYITWICIKGKLPVFTYLVQISELNFTCLLTSEEEEKTANDLRTLVPHHYP